MKLYAVEASGRYAGGVAIVVAPNEETVRALCAELYEELERVRAFFYHVRYDNPEVIRELTPALIPGGARVLHHFEAGE
mgnify:CR=1 FL=1